MKLYDLKAGLNPRRVRIFLAEKGIEVPSVQVDMMKHENDAPDYLAKNPMGKMPILELDDGEILAESVAICRYFEAQQPEPPLFGNSPREQAFVEMWNRRMELEIMLPMVNVFQHTSDFWKGRIEQVPAWGDLNRGKLAERMKWLDGELAERPYIAGDNYTIADITAQCAFVMGKGIGMRIPEELVNLTRWFEQVSGRPTARA
ncbi:MAG: glutathione S-transferase family protein [Alphaproteobacteria bacterium]